MKQRTSKFSTSQHHKAAFTSVCCRAKNKRKEDIHPRVFCMDMKFIAILPRMFA